ncbi:MAG: hypothetical protein JXB24_10535 [Bacteroidales bacterium]|nr:hypothetical protein [Bacteroidales bacterium]
MRKSIAATLCCFLVCLTAAGQSATYRTMYGDRVSPENTLYTLNIFINIIFDQTPEADPLKGITTEFWLPGQPNTINDNPPLYLDDFMDSEFDPENIRGSFTKRWAEASFNKFIVLGDFTVVNISQSRITPDDPGAGFGKHDLVDAVVALINEKGGLNTIHDHESINDYDGREITPATRFLPKGSDYDEKIDFIQIFVRNCTSTHGGMSGGGNALFYLDNGITIDGTVYENNAGTIQGAIKNTDLGHPNSSPSCVHEMAHYLYGDNTMHMGGGGPVHSTSSGSLVTLDYNSGGYSLITSSNQSLISCTGYERYRLNWRGPGNENYPIAAESANSDIDKGMGLQTLYLRDFITTGDAIRIKLPYTDPEALNQYIWLENHRIYSNGKEDYPAWFDQECKDSGVAGIYSYYQVGKETLQSDNSIDDLLPNYCDHLVPICADGNWDVRALSTLIDACTFNDPGGTPVQEYYQPNPFSGYNDLKNHFFNSTPYNGINWKRDRIEPLIKLKDGITTNSMQQSGDNSDAFQDNSSIHIGTNPASVPVVTYCHKRYSSGMIEKTSVFPDNRKIHLYGLRIDFDEGTTGVFKVDIVWNYYDINNSVRWTGDIVLHEQVNLLEGRKITLAQNHTPNKHTRDAVTGVFAGPTYFTCLENSVFKMQANSEVELTNLSSFLLESGSNLELHDGAKFIVEEGSTLVLKAGSGITVEGSGHIEVKPGGYICIEENASIYLQNELSVINLHSGYISGVNTDVITESTNCIADPSAATFSGNGHINNFGTDVYVQNEILSSDTYYAGQNIYAGEAVTSQQTQGPVIIQSGAEVILDADGDVVLDEGFELAEGGIFETR